MKTKPGIENESYNPCKAPRTVMKAVSLRMKTVLGLVTVLCGLLATSHAQTNRPTGWVVAWGDNSSGQTNVPPGLNDVVAVAAGYDHSLALKSNGTVVAWGGNAYGQAIVPVGLTGITAIAAGAYYSLALKSDGTIVAWGDNASGQSSVPEGLHGVTAIAACADHSLALKSDGTVVGWGYLGYYSYVPSGLSNVIVIAAGYNHSLALRSDGTVVAWGLNSGGQCDVPAGLNNVVSIAAGSNLSLALKSDGTVVAWGYAWAGRTEVPPGLTGVRAIAAGDLNSLALKSDGTVVSWGGFGYGLTNVPKDLRGVLAVAVQKDHCLALIGLPKVTIVPRQQPVAVSSSVQFHADVVGAPALSYQWFFNSTNAVSEPTANADLLLTNVQFSQAGAYSVVVTNFVGAVTSSPAMLDVFTDPGIGPTTPLIRKAWIGATVEFDATAVGTPPLDYQWFFNANNAIAGATNSVLRLTDLQVTQSGTYTVVVTNALGAATGSPAILNVVEDLVVTNSAEADLRAAMTAGGKVDLACDGTITLVDTIAIESETVLDGSGHHVTISGGNAVRVFSVATNVNLTLINVTIAEGNCTNGAGIFNDGGTLTLQQVAFERNTACVTESTPEYWNRPGPEGGAILNRGGTVNATNCTFSENRAMVVPEDLNLFGNPPSRGGAIRNENGVIHLKESTFKGNSARGSSGLFDNWTPFANGLGGAIHNSGTARAESCSFLQNSATGGGASGDPAQYYDTDGGSGFGGAIYNLGSLEVRDSALINNAAVGGQGSDGHDGGIFGDPSWGIIKLNQVH